MEKLITTLIEIDEKATHKLETAKASAEKLVIDAKNGADLKHKNLLAKADKRIEKIKVFYAELTAEETDKQIQKLEKEMYEMDSQWALKKESVLNAIYTEILTIEN